MAFARAWLLLFAAVLSSSVVARWTYPPKSPDDDSLRVLQAIASQHAPKRFADGLLINQIQLLFLSCEFI